MLAGSSCRKPPGLVMNQPLASETSAIGMRHDPGADGAGDGSGGAGMNADGDGDAVETSFGVLAAPATGIGLPPNPASLDTDPQAWTARQQPATSAAPLACMSFIQQRRCQPTCIGLPPFVRKRNTIPA